MHMVFDKLLGRSIPKNQFDIRQLEREKSSLEMHIESGVKWKFHTLESMPLRLKEVNIELNKLKERA
jgi:hypothetical protein